MILFVLFICGLLALWMASAVNEYPHGHTPAAAEAEAQSVIDIAQYEAHREATYNPPVGDWITVPITNPDALPGDPYP